MTYRSSPRAIAVHTASGVVPARRAASQTPRRSNCSLTLCVSFVFAHLARLVAAVITAAVWIAGTMFRAKAAEHVLPLDHGVRKRQSKIAPHVIEPTRRLPATAVVGPEVELIFGRLDTLAKLDHSGI